MPGRPLWGRPPGTAGVPRILVVALVFVGTAFLVGLLTNFSFGFPTTHP
jgi:hypothetical protein